MSVQQLALLDQPLLAADPMPAFWEDQASLGTPSSAIVGKVFGRLTVAQYEGAGRWCCDCDACQSQHVVDWQILNRGFACEAGGGSREDELLFRSLLKARRNDPQFIAAARFTARTSKKQGRTIGRINPRLLQRSFWAGLRNDCLTLVEALGQSHWLCYCDRCGKLKIRKDSFLLKQHRDACGCFADQQRLRG